jgi:putative alpha-1,2-mannosidase
MSAWYLFSALGFYPVNPVSGEYVVGSLVLLCTFNCSSLDHNLSPFFDKATLNLPGHAKPLVISAEGAPSTKYIRSLTIDGESVAWPIIRHEQIAAGGDVRFEMSDVPETWGGVAKSSGSSF